MEKPVHYSTLPNWLCRVMDAWYTADAGAGAGAATAAGAIGKETTGTTTPNGAVGKYASRSMYQLRV